ncbi:MAG: hypothetical protein IPN33_16810 [Saprospiraceae bacterium]|nr:hypothetical protein [Saprospiraceae bacterium]
MLVLFIALLVLVLVVAAFSGNNDRRRDSYRQRRRYDDYDPYQSYYPPQSYPPYIEPVWGRSRWEHGGGGDKSVYGFVAIVALGLLGYYVFANSGPGLNKDGPTRETYMSGLITSNVSSSSATPTTKSVFPAEHTLKYTAGQSTSQPEVYTVDIPGEPAGDLVDEYEHTDRPEPLGGCLHPDRVVFTVERRQNGTGSLAQSPR